VGYHYAQWLESTIFQRRLLSLAVDGDKIMQCVFVQIRCRPGTTYAVAEEITRREVHSELYSTSGDFDLMAKIYVEKDVDIGRFVNENIANIADVKRTRTTLTFKAF